MTSKMIRLKKAATVVGAGAMALASDARGQLPVDPPLLSVVASDDSAVLSDAFVADTSAISIRSVSYVGALEASGTYASGPLGIPDGVLLTSGAALLALPPDDSTSTTARNGFPGHVLCDPLVSPSSSLDGSHLRIEFELAAGFDGISFQSIFGSEEYPEFVGSNFNDAFGSFSTGSRSRSTARATRSRSTARSSAAPRSSSRQRRRPNTTGLRRY